MVLPEIRYGKRRGENHIAAIELSTGGDACATAFVHRSRFYRGATRLELDQTAAVENIQNPGDDDRNHCQQTQKTS